MLPIEFKDQLQMALNIYLRPTEAAAVAEFFDIDGVGSVNGEYFVRWFLQAGNNARQVTVVCGYVWRWMWSEGGTPNCVACF